jgi:hypothetical protein
MPSTRLRRVAGKGILLDHGTGVVIGETAVIGNNVSLMQNVTLGGATAANRLANALGARVWMGGVADHLVRTLSVHVLHGSPAFQAFQSPVTWAHQWGWSPLSPTQAVP